MLEGKMGSICFFVDNNIQNYSLNFTLRLFIQ